MPPSNDRKDNQNWDHHVWDDGRSIYGGARMGAALRTGLEQLRRARVAQERAQQESAAPVRAMGEELDARAAAVRMPSSIADSGLGGSRATTVAQAEGGGGGSFNKYVATLQALRAGYPDAMSAMAGERHRRIGPGGNLNARHANRMAQLVGHFAWEVEQRWKDYRARGGQLDMTDFINKYDYGQNREAYIEQRGKEDNLAKEYVKAEVRRSGGRA